VKSWRDEDLILFVYGEHPKGRELELELEARPELRERLAALRRQLAVFDEPAAPEPRPGLEDRVWARLRPQLASGRGVREPHRILGWLGIGRAWRLAAVAAALVVTLLGAFVLGRRSVAPPPVTVAAAQPFSAAARERLLASSVSGHLESSSLLLTDLSHAAPDQGLGEERDWAASLLAENRLYRRAAERAGQRRIVELLDELEPLLVELANTPAGSAGGEVTSLQQRIDERDLLFKVRVVGARLRSSTL
jgi:hypothetical protein